MLGYEIWQNCAENGFSGLMYWASKVIAAQNFAQFMKPLYDSDNNKTVYAPNVNYV